MISVIKSGKEKVFFTKCLRCASELTYEFSDVQSKPQTKYCREERFIVCLICGEKLNVCLYTKEEMKISAEDILLLINKKISKRIVNNEIYVSFENCEIKDGNFLSGCYGIGDTIPEACEDYLKKICNKTLVFNAYSEHRKEITVIVRSYIMNLTGAGLTREIERSAAVQACERVSCGGQKKIKCPKCGFEMSSLQFKDNAVCRGLKMKCKNKSCKHEFEIKINEDKIKD